MLLGNIYSILQGKIPLWIKIKSYAVSLKKKYIVLCRGSFKGLKNKEGFSDYNIDTSSFESKNKKLGISGIARLRNAKDFLQISIESHLTYFDEIILADNMSEDETRDICLRLQKKYPQKIKAIQYPFLTHKLGSEEYKKSTSDSVYDLSYFYNRVLSHVSYRRVAKVDDDHLMIPVIMGKNREVILSDTSYTSYYHMLGINTVYNNKQYSIPTQGPFMGLYGDHGFFPISKKTYYIHDNRSENFIHPYGIQYLPISFIHLKYLRNYHKNYLGSYNTFNDDIFNGGYIDIPGRYREVLKKRGL